MASNPTSIGQSEIIGTDAFSDKHIYDAKAGKVATMKQLDDAYNQRLEELDGLEPAEKQRMEKSNLSVQSVFIKVWHYVYFK